MILLVFARLHQVISLFAAFRCIFFCRAVCGGPSNGNIDHDRVAHTCSLDQALDSSAAATAGAAGLGGTEEPRSSHSRQTRQDVSEGDLEAHIQEHIGFVQYQYLQLTHIDVVVSSHHIVKTAGSSDDDVGPMLDEGLQIVRYRAIGPADEQERFGKGAVLAQIGGNDVRLSSQLSRGGDDETANLSLLEKGRAAEDHFDGGDEKGERLA